MITPEQIEKIKKLKAFQLLPTVQSKDVQWINWMKELSKEFDRATAVSIFLNLWEKRGTADARTILLRTFMKDKYNVDLGEGLLDRVADFGNGVGDTIAGVFKTGKTIALIGIGLTGLAVIGIIYAVVKNPQVLTMITPAGRAASVAGGLNK